MVLSVAVAPLLLVVDFDGTITQRDTLHTMVARFGAPGAWEALEPALRSGELSVAQAVYAQFSEIVADEATVIEVVRRETELRRGFRDFLSWADRHHHRVVVLSAGFRRVIDAVLGDAGIVGLEVRANDIRFGPGGARIEWRRGESVCAECGHACKRPDVEALRATGRPLVYLGDGMSDRCAARHADIVFARAALARDLGARGRTFHPFDDFHEVVATLADRDREAA